MKLKVNLKFYKYFTSIKYSFTLRTLVLSYQIYLLFIINIFQRSHNILSCVSIYANFYSYTPYQNETENKIQLIFFSFLF